MSCGVCLQWEASSMSGVLQMQQAMVSSIKAQQYEDALSIADQSMSCVQIDTCFQQRAICHRQVLCVQY